MVDDQKESHIGHASARWKRKFEMIANVSLMCCVRICCVVCIRSAQCCTPPNAAITK